MADEKTILLSDVKLYRARTFLFAEEEYGQYGFVNPLPVQADDGRLLGWGSADLEGFLNLALDYATPERLEIETGARKLYANPAFAPQETDSLRAPEIVAVVLRATPLYPGQPAIGEVIL